jgi:cellulose synthase/poly-beta-1,6-N-acetylglucosamine synthase-like glycosyltransferase
MLLDLLLVLTCAYTLKIIVFAVAALNARYPSDRTYAPRVAIVIAARNEEENIGRCLDSIVALSYPVHLLDVIVVDDRSTDRTASIIQQYSRSHPHIRSLMAEPGKGTLCGKTNAVAQGIEATAGDIILFTDADCTVQSGWVEETVKYYTSPAIGVVAGFTSLRSRSAFESIQALDWFVLFSVAAATVRLRYPVTAVGNNLSVRRSAYDAVGGYRTIPFSVTEDYALFHAITHHDPYEARFPLDPRTLVESEPCRHWGDLYRQKVRWFTGGRGMDIKSLLIFTIPYGFNAGLILATLLQPSLLVAACVALKLLVDLFLSLPSLVRFKRTLLLRHFLLFEVYYIAYVLLFPIIVLFATNVVWKQRKYRGNAKKT